MFLHYIRGHRTTCLRLLTGTCRNSEREFNVECTSEQAVARDIQFVRIQAQNGTSEVSMQITSWLRHPIFSGRFHREPESTLIEAIIATDVPISQKGDCTRSAEHSVGHMFPA
jgi:hypothetical protein